jgi:hypothetical protein
VSALPGFLDKLVSLETSLYLIAAESPVLLGPLTTPSTVGPEAAPIVVSPIQKLLQLPCFLPRDISDGHPVALGTRTLQPHLSIPAFV